MFKWCKVSYPLYPSPLSIGLHTTSLATSLPKPCNPCRHRPPQQRVRLKLPLHGQPYYQLNENVPQNPDPMLNPCNRLAPCCAVHYQVVCFCFSP